MSAESIKTIEEVTIHLAGDSGDGMQLVGHELTNIMAITGSDIGTLPDYPSEIRAPAGTVAGVSGFRLHVGSIDVHTPGDEVDVLLAMNPAALKANIKSLKPNGVIITNMGEYHEKGLKLAGYEHNPLMDGSLDKYQTFSVDMNSLTKEALKSTGLDAKTIDRCTNFFALGMALWLFNKSLDNTIEFINEKFAKKQQIAEANRLALQAGYSYCAHSESFAFKYEIPSAKLKPGKYRNLVGNEAVALGCAAAAQKAGLNLFLGSYPITPATEILQALANLKEFGVKALQAEDEIAGICSAIGAAYAGSLSITSTSGPGLCLKSEAIGLAVMTELPLVIVNVQRAGPSTGLPTKTEQSDLLQAMWGRNGESPVAILAASCPSDCFECAYEACRIALKYMTPVVLLLDGYIGNGSEPWLIPSIKQLPDITVERHTDANTFEPYMRNPATLSRPWAIPGTRGFEHRVGGLEKKHIVGSVSHDPDNHDFMVKLRAEKIKKIENEIAPITVFGPDSGELLVLGWGGTYGAIRTAVENSARKGLKVSHLHLRWINPLPKDLLAVLKRFKHVLIPEINLGQLSRIIRSEYLIETINYNKVRGLPLTAKEIQIRIEEILGGKL
jgi:2-oxoglutarate/2-oxoacid ferredoxin oxidoreductase subunit alpha